MDDRGLDKNALHPAARAIANFGKRLALRLDLLPVGGHMFAVYQNPRTVPLSNLGHRADPMAESPEFALEQRNDLRHTYDPFLALRNVLEGSSLKTPWYLSANRPKSHIPNLAATSVMVTSPCRRSHNTLRA